MSANQKNQTLTARGYRIEKILGQGSFGAVFKVRPIGDPDQTLVIKKIVLKKTDKKEREQEEAVIKNEYDNQLILSQSDTIGCIVKMINMESKRNEYLLFMEFVDGKDLFFMIDKHLIEPTMVKNFFRQLILALKFIHRQGFVHIDIKPENIMITRSNVLKLADFGLSTQYVFDGVERKVWNHYGTEGYAPPETFSSDREIEGPPADIWAAGMVLLNMVTGELNLWEKADMSDELYGKWDAGSFEQGHIFSQIEQNAMDLLRKMLCEDPDQRATINDIMSHPWFNDKNHPYISRIQQISSLFRCIVS